MANTQVILLQRVENLGQMGDVVAVKPGYARNFLLPQNKALRANKSNIAYFEAQKKVLEAANQTKKADAEKVAKKMGDFSVVIIRQAAEGGQLYGSVTTRDIAEAAAAAGVNFDRSQVYINQAYKTLGLFAVDVFLHPEVKVSITINIARSEEEAKVQKKLGRAVVADAEGKLNTAAPSTDKAALMDGSAYAAEQAEEAAYAAEAAADAANSAEKSAKRAAKKATKKTDDVTDAEGETDTAEDAAE